MKLWGALLCLVALISIDSSAKGSTLYGVVTVPTGTETLLWTVQIDTTSGSVTNVTEAMAYAGGSGTTPGISTFDQTNGIYYWATNMEDAFVHSVDVNKKQLLPPLDIGATEIVSLNYYASKQRLLILFYVEGQGSFVVSAGPGVVNIVFQLSSFNSGLPSVVGVDETRQLYHLIVDAGKTPFLLDTYNMGSGDLVSQVALDSKTCGSLYPQFATYDAESEKMIGGAELFNDTNGSVQYFYTAISPKTGICQKTALPVLTGLVPCWTYNALSNELWLVDATPAGGFIYSFNTQSGQLSKPVHVNPFIPENIAISYH